MADAAEVRGGHERLKGAAIAPREGAPLDKEGNTALAASSAAYMKRLFGKKPHHVELDRVFYQDGKIKWIAHCFYAAGTKNGKEQFTEKRKCACVYKNGRILSGKWPEGEEMPSELKARIAATKRGAEA